MHSREHGVIFGWSGNPLFLPDGFVLCDGSNDTPDLRNEFVVGAGLTYAVSAGGGVTVHNHPFTANLHQHQIVASGNVASGSNFAGFTGFGQPQGTTDNANGLPPFYSLVFLMKL